MKLAFFSPDEPKVLGLIIAERELEQLMEALHTPSATHRAIIQHLGPDGLITLLAETDEDYDKSNYHREQVAE